MGNVCGSAPQVFEEEPELAPPPDSPSWKLPSFPAPILPPLTRQTKIIISSSRYVDDEDEKQKTKKAVLNGSENALSIVFDDSEVVDIFIPEVKKLFSLALTITCLELHTANLDIEPDFLQSFLDTLPSHGELKAFSLVTGRDSQLVYSGISVLLYRNPGLQALRLWGIDLTPAGSGNQYYPQCRLVRVDLSQCRMLPQQLDNLLGASRDSLLCLKFDKLSGLSGSHLARAVSNYGKKVQMLSILLPDYSESEMDLKASYLVGDTASRFPTNLKFLHLAGLAASDNLFTVVPNVIHERGEKEAQAPSTHLSNLVALRLDNCPRLTVNSLFAAIRQRSLPQLLRLHVYWFDNEEAYNDIELWKTFAASEDIQISTEEEGLLHLTANKEAPVPPPHPIRLPKSQKQTEEVRDAQAVAQQKLLQNQPLMQERMFGITPAISNPGFLGAPIYPAQAALAMPQPPLQFGLSQPLMQPIQPPPAHFADVKGGEKIQYLQRGERLQPTKRHREREGRSHQRAKDRVRHRYGRRRSERDDFDDSDDSDEESDSESESDSDSDSDSEDDESQPDYYHDTFAGRSPLRRPAAPYRAGFR